MILKVYSVWDNNVKTYLGPMPVPHVGHAIRRFDMEVNKPDSMYGRYAQDYELHEIGTFDETTGEMVSCKPQLIQKATEVKATEPTPLRQSTG